VEPAPEIVAEPPLEELLDELELELLDELELLLPQAARPNESKATLASAPILFLITTSPLLDYVSMDPAGVRGPAGSCAQRSLLIARSADVNIS
jgi:hypothetical protein